MKFNFQNFTKLRVCPIYCYNLFSTIDVKQEAENIKTNTLNLIIKRQNQLFRVFQIIFNFFLRNFESWRVSWFRKTLKKTFSQKKVGRSSASKIEAEVFLKVKYVQVSPFFANIFKADFAARYFDYFHVLRGEYEDLHI